MSATPENPRTEAREYKAFDSAAPQNREVREALDAFMRAFEEFKTANDERLAQIDQRLTADTVTAEKVERLNQSLDLQKKALDEMAIDRLRPQLAGVETSAAPDFETRAHKAAFDSYIRKGSAAALARFESKALSAGTDTQGGYLVPDEIESRVGSLMRNISPIRAIASVRRVSANLFRKPVLTAGPAADWAAETAARTASTTENLQETTFPVHELYAMPAASTTLLDDAGIDVAQWLAEEIYAVFAQKESEAFVTGSGTNRPKGFTQYPTVADSSWAWGKIGFLKSGRAGGFPATGAQDKLVDLVYALKPGYRAEAHWVMNRKTIAAIRKIKDNDGNYIWQPAPRAGQAATLLNFPVAEAEHMPDLANDALAVAFGNFRQAYLIVDRAGLRILRDPYSSKPHVLFYTTRRVGGGVQNFEALKLLKFAA